MDLKAQYIETKSRTWYTRFVKHDTKLWSNEILVQKAVKHGVNFRVIKTCTEGNKLEYSCRRSRGYPRPDSPRHKCGTCGDLLLDLQLTCSWPTSVLNFI